MGAAMSLGLLPVGISRALAGNMTSTPWDRVAAIRARIKPPVFPEQDFDVTDFGAVGDGVTVNTGAFKTAITSCSAAGGGRVVVPAGCYLTGPIHLESNINLHVSEGAELLFSQTPADYLPLVQTWFEGVELMNYSPFIYAFGSENVAVTGRGILNGQADFDVWWSWRGPRSWKGAKSGTTSGWQEGMPYQKASRSLLMDMAADGLPVKKRLFGEGHYIRSAMIEFNRCKNVLIQDVTIRNAAFWSVHPVLSTNVTARGVSIDNPVGANADGIDPECCSDVLIENCSFDTGDDCISIKSGRDHDGRRINTPCQDVVISGCHFSSERSAISCGSESSGGVRNIFVENVTAETVFRLFRIKTNTNRGGVNKNIHIRNATVTEALENFIEIQTNFSEPLKDGPGDARKRKFIPVIRNISLSDINCGPVGRAFNFPGTSETPIRNLVLNRLTTGPAKKENVLSHLLNPVATQVSINGKPFSF
jgi:polygalacturonase